MDKDEEWAAIKHASTWEDGYDSDDEGQKAK